MRSDFHIRAKLSLITGIVSLLMLSPARADLDEIFHFSFGGTVTQYDTKVRFTSRDGTIDAGIDLEDDVGYDPEVSTGFLRTWYRVGDNHRLALTYVPSNRTSFLVSTEDIEVGDDIIKAGAGMAWDTQNRLLDVSYIYSFYHRPDIELGLSAGVYWLRHETSLLVAGEVQSPNEPEPIFRAYYANSFKLHAPLPIIGIIADYEINPSWRVHGQLRYLSVTISEYDGKIVNAAISTDYFFTKSFGVGFSLNSFTLEVDVESIILNGALTWSHNGAQVYVVYKY